MAAQGSESSEKSVLVPLTNSLYVRGELSDPKHVIVDIGTGFYVEKACFTLIYRAPDCKLRLSN
ncbi:prefoldin subunit 5 [Colletotrichum spaethianum]|uniref:Prefoldin subunit 5 n=1 Tax=Colletotrichum spaethianum TaxID=700344 RepID=A0AA37PA10_9PEZI|nr:prefoldin subunit 5 [Colletotrichum spaethianum]GKT48403.1 prefoldin subunit 5 [Colletotrichum spaethianum]